MEGSTKEVIPVGSGLRPALEHGEENKNEVWPFRNQTLNLDVLSFCFPHSTQKRPSPAPNNKKVINTNPEGSQIVSWGLLWKFRAGRLLVSCCFKIGSLLKPLDYEDWTVSEKGLQWISFFPQISLQGFNSSSVELNYRVCET